MTSSDRLGDLLRVVDALDPDDEQLRLIAELLPDVRGPRTTAVRRPVRRRRDGAEPVVASGDRTRRDPAPLDEGRGRRRAGRRLRQLVGRTDRRSLLPSLLPDPGLYERAWWVVVGVLVLLVLGVRVTGRFQSVPWPLVVGVLLLARPVWWSARLGWSAWWRSPQHHASLDAAVPAPTADEDGEGDGDAAGGTSVALTHVRWREPLPPAPLVRPGQQRSVATLLAGRAVAGEIDLAETVRRRASRQPLVPVPRRRRWSTNQGMHLHVDMGPALDPFRADVDQLREALVTVASPHGVVELGFHGDPRRITWPPRLAGYGGSVPLGDCLPPPGTTVLVLTDLGIAVTRSGPTPEPEDLLDYHRRLVQAGCRVHYLVPYPPERWPAALRGLPILHWSDELGPGEVLAGFRRRARVG